jgi:mannosyltransferase OCH1-like enzyme
MIPQRYMKLINSVKVNNPNYKYLFFTDKDIEEFLKSYYPEYYETFLKLPKIIQKIDFFRYIAVYHFGGFYLDLDMKVLSCFDDLLHNSCVFPIDEYINERLCNYVRYNSYCEKGQNFLLGQYAFGAEPNNEFIKLLIDIIHERIDYYIQNFEKNSEDYIYKSTGPDYVTDIYMEYGNKNSITILDNGKRQYFGNYAKHNYFGTWK